VFPPSLRSQGEHDALRTDTVSLPLDNKRSHVASATSERTTLRDDTDAFASLHATVPSLRADTPPARQLNP